MNKNRKIHYAERRCTRSGCRFNNKAEFECIIFLLLAFFIFFCALFFLLLWIFTAKKKKKIANKLISFVCLSKIRMCFDLETNIVNRYYFDTTGIPVYNMACMLPIPEHFGSGTQFINIFCNHNTAIIMMRFD